MSREGIDRTMQKVDGKALAELERSYVAAVNRRQEAEARRREAAAALHDAESEELRILDLLERARGRPAPGAPQAARSSRRAT